MQFLVLEHGGRNRGGDPQYLLLLLDLGRKRDRVRARIDAVDDVDLLLADQAFGLVDRDIGLALGIGSDRDDLVLAADAALLVNEIDRNLRADRGGNRAARGKRTGEVVDHADAHGFGLRLRAGPIEAQHGGRRRGILEQPSARSRHRILPTEPSFQTGFSSFWPSIWRMHRKVNTRVVLRTSSRHSGSPASRSPSSTLCILLLNAAVPIDGSNVFKVVFGHSLR